MLDIPCAQTLREPLLQRTGAGRAQAHYTQRPLQLNDYTTTCTQLLHYRQPSKLDFFYQHTGFNACMRITTDTVANQAAHHA
jgi:hypothetical protein